MTFNFVKLVLNREVYIVLSLVQQLFLQLFLNLHHILFLIDSLVASPALQTSFLDSVFASSSPDFVAISNSFFLLLPRNFFANDKKPHLFHVFSSFWFYKIGCHLYLLISNVKLILSSISNGLPFSFLNLIVMPSNSVLYVFQNAKLLGSTQKHKIYFAACNP